MLIDQALQLRLKDLRKAGMLQEGRRVKAEAVNGRHGYEITVDYTNAERPFLHLKYRHGSAGLQEYTIDIEARRSNLGKGTCFYFLCPVSGRRSLTLYMAYNSPVFKAREAYSIRLYYQLQLTGGRSRRLDQYFSAERKVEQLQQRRAYFSYKGQATRYAKRLQAAISKADQYDRLRWAEGFPIAAF